MLGDSVNSYPIPAVGSILSSLGLCFLQPPIRKGMLVEAIWAERTRSTTLIKVSTRFTPGEEEREAREDAQQIRLSQWSEHQNTPLASLINLWVMHVSQLSFSLIKWRQHFLKSFSFVYFTASCWVSHHYNPPKFAKKHYELAPCFSDLLFQTVDTDQLVESVSVQQWYCYCLKIV